MLKKKYKVLIASTLFLLPFLILYLMFTIYPMVQGLYMSLYKWTIIRKMDFVGLANYQKMLSDSDFWGALKNTTFFVVVSTPYMVEVQRLLNRKSPILLIHLV